MFPTFLSTVFRIRDFLLVWSLYQQDRSLSFRSSACSGFPHFFFRSGSPADLLKSSRLVQGREDGNVVSISRTLWIIQSGRLDFATTKQNIGELKIQENRKRKKIARVHPLFGYWNVTKMGFELKEILHPLPPMYYVDAASVNESLASK